MLKHMNQANNNYATAPKQRNRWNWQIFCCNYQIILKLNHLQKQLICQQFQKEKEKEKCQKEKVLKFNNIVKKIKKNYLYILSDN